MLTLKGSASLLGAAARVPRQGARSVSCNSTAGQGVPQGRAWRTILAAASCLLVLLLTLSFIPVTRRVLVGGGLALLGGAGPIVGSASAGEGPGQRVGEVAHSEAEWRALLGDDLAYRVLRQAATERSNTSPLNKEKRAGTFVCAGCGARLFDSSTKFDSGTGWPSFVDVLPGAVDETEDRSIPFMTRVEVRCHRCQGHLGHVFDDGPPPTGLRYCMNGVAMKFVPAA